MPPLRTLWKYYPEKKGLCTGCVLAAFGFSAMIFNKISNIIINPHNKPMDTQTTFYPKEVGEKVPTFFYTASLIILCSSFFSVIFLFEHKEDEEELKITQAINFSESPTSPDGNINTDKSFAVEETVKVAVKSRRFKILCFFPYILTNLIRPYGSLSLDEESLNLIMLLFPIVNGSTRILWGFLCDYFGFKFVYLFLLSLGLIISTTISFISTNPFMYSLYCLVSVSLIAGNYSVLPFVASKVFGIKNSSEVYGIIFLCCGLGVFSGPFVIKFVIGNSNDKSLFHEVFWIGSVMQLICIILCITFKEEKFDYIQENEKSEKLNEN